MIVTIPEFEEIYLNSFSKLYNVAFRITGTSQDAEDALQEAYISAYKSISQFNQKSSINTWLYKITVNSSLKYIKKRNAFPVSYMSKEQGISENAFFERLKSYDSVEDEVLYNDMRESCLQMFIECLPKMQRISFVLKVIMGLSVIDVSDILEISESSVKTNVFRARDTMKKHMNGKCSFIDPKNPCQCNLWVNYAIKNNKKHLIPKLQAPKRPLGDLKKQVLTEMNFLKKISILYNNEPNYPAPSKFISNIKKMISNENLKIFN